jgi:hypothetical protein
MQAIIGAELKRGKCEYIAMTSAITTTTTYYIHARDSCILHQRDRIDHSLVPIGPWIESNPRDPRDAIHTFSFDIRIQPP